STSSKRGFLYIARFGPTGVHWLQGRSGDLTRAGFSAAAIQDRANMSCSLVRSLARNVPHSMVWSVTFTPTALRFDWMIVLMATGDCMPDPDSGTPRVGGKPLARPASARSFLARSGS